MPSDKTTAIRGIFISFEGGDGVGKSTQIKNVAEALRQQQCTVLETREPGGCEGAEVIRDLLVNGPADRWTSLSEALMMYAARAEHLDKTILPALENGSVVLSDRFADSSMAYQGYAGDVGKSVVETLHGIVVGDNDPDLTIVLYADPKEGLARADERQSGEHRFESKGVTYQQAVTDAFKSIALENDKRCVLIDATDDIETVTRNILREINQRFVDRLKKLQKKES